MTQLFAPRFRLSLASSIGAVSFAHLYMCFRQMSIPKTDSVALRATRTLCLLSLNARARLITRVALQLTNVLT